MSWISEIQSFKHSLYCRKHEISRFMQQHIRRRLIKQMRERKRYVFRIQLMYLGYVIYYKSPSKNSHIALKLHMYPNTHIKSKKLIWVQATGFNSTCFSFLITLLSLRSFNEHKASSNKLLMWTMVYQYAYVPKLQYLWFHIFIKQFLSNMLYLMA